MPTERQPEMTAEEIRLTIRDAKIQCLANSDTTTAHGLSRLAVHIGELERRCEERRVEVAGCEQVLEDSAALWKAAGITLRGNTVHVAPLQLSYTIPDNG